MGSRWMISLGLHWPARPEATSIPSARADGGDGLLPITVVTGGSEGLGLALARRYAAAGHTLAILARHQDRLAAAGADLRSNGATVIELALDVSAAGTPATLEAALAARGYFIDMLINNAGVGLSGPFAAGSESDIIQLLDVNMTGLTRLMRQVLPGMMARGRGGILNVASLAGYVPGPHQAAYYASKAYVISLSKAVAWEVAGTGVQVSVLVPGPIETRFHERIGALTAYYWWLIPSMPAERVASAGFWGFRLGCRVIVPGVIWLALALAMRLLPNMILIRIMGWLLKLRPAGEIDAGSKNGG